MNYLLSSLFCLCLLSASAFCGEESNRTLKVCGLFTDHAVFQRDVPIRIWGEGREDAQVEVVLNGQRVTTRVTDGKWEIELPAHPAGGPFDLTIQSGEDAKNVRDIYFGDVWLAAGQSNMQMTFGAVPELAARSNEFLTPRVRVIGNRIAMSTSPRDECGAYDWFIASQDNLKWTSVVGYLFGVAYAEKFDTPVGIIMCNQGSTGIETWMPREALFEAMPDMQAPDGGPPLIEGAALGELFKTGKPCLPSGMYNAMIYPLMRFPIKGVLWYQGENNAGQPMQYARLLESLVTGWRRAWNNPEMPFLVAQLSSYGEAKWDATGEAWAWLREQQQTAVDRIHNTGLAVTYDLGEFADIHPRAKEQVAARLFDVWMSVHSGGPGQLGPRLAKSHIEGSRIRVSFQPSGVRLVAADVVMNKEKGMATGLDPAAFRASSRKLSGFEICGEDHHFVKAEAKIEGGDVLVESPNVKTPIAVRYAWGNFALANLFDDKGRPAIPFRTDGFEPPQPLTYK